MEFRRRKKTGSRSGALWRSAAGLIAVGCAGQAGAFELDVDPDVAARWDNTFKYSLMERLKDPSNALISPPTTPPVPPPAGNIAGANFDDGDRNLKKGLVSNRLDWFSELDVSYRGWTGFRVSGAAWYDSIYNRHNDNTSPATVNSASVPAGEFPDATRDLMGKWAELLDAFVFAKGDVGGMAWSARAGKHTLLYGETLFFGANGIAGGQAPVDVIKLLSVPDSQFKEILLPVPQVSGQLQVSSRVTVGAYYQLQWKRTRLPPSGSYFSNFDPIDVGGEKAYLFTGAPPPFGPLTTLTRAQDIDATNAGQGGVELRWRPEAIDAEFGLYATRYHDKTPQLYVYPVAAPLPPIPHTYNEVFPQGIRSYGASFSTVVASANVAGEISVRRNTPLVSTVVLLNQAQAAVANNSSNPFYAVGNSVHANLSTIISLSPGLLWQGGSVLGEVGANRRTGITKNPTALDPNADRDAWGFRGVFEPAYYQVFRNIDLTVPIGLGYNPKGKSSVVAAFNGGVHHGGDLSVGVSGEYRKVWKAGIKYTHYLGDANVLVIPSASPYSPLMNSYGQTLKDRDFLSFSIQYTL
jgi:hypothetical protein